MTDPSGHPVVVGRGPTFEEAMAWAEAALPEGWIVRTIEQDGMTWDAIATPYGSPVERAHGTGDTPTDALIALTIELDMRGIR